MGTPGAEIAGRQGVAVLHELEEEVLLDALSATQPTVIAAAGWVVEAERCRDALADPVVGEVRRSRSDPP